MPEEFTEYILCTEMYHCTPSQLNDEDYYTIVDHLAIRAGIAQARER